MSAQDEAAVRAANAAWFDALNAMLHGDPMPLADVYSHADDVSYMSAEGGIRIGWEATWRDWQAQAKLSRGGQVDEIQSHIVVCGDMAVVQSLETAVVRDMNSAAVESTMRESSVFRREGDDWKMIAHHADAIPTWVEVAGAARDV